MISPAQLRAARGFLDLTREELADASGVSPETIMNMEHGRFKPQAETIQRLRLTFMRQGVTFFDLLARFPLWGIVVQPPHAYQQNNRVLTEAATTVQVHLSLVDLMATAIASMLRLRGHCRPRDLEAKGFTPEEVASAWAMANALAQVQLMESEE